MNKHICLDNKNKNLEETRVYDAIGLSIGIIAINNKISIEKYMQRFNYKGACCKGCIARTSDKCHDCKSKTCIRKVLANFKGTIITKDSHEGIVEK